MNPISNFHDRNHLRSYPIDKETSQQSVQQCQIGNITDDVRLAARSSGTSITFQSKG